MQTALSVEDNLLDPVVIVAANKIMAGGRFEVAGLSQANMDKSKNLRTGCPSRRHHA